MAHRLSRTVARQSGAIDSPPRQPQRIFVPTTQQTNFGANDQPVPRDSLSAIIARNVIRSLGSPADMLRVQVATVGIDRYRVNIFVGKNYGVGRITNSFFLTADSEGNIESSSPKIERVY
jgi:hypothetical protein